MTNRQVVAWLPRPPVHGRYVRRVKPWKAVFFLSLLGALLVCRFAHAAPPAGPPRHAAASILRPAA